MKWILSWLRRYRLYFLIFGFALFAGGCCVVFRRLLQSDDPLATGGWFFFGTAFLLFYCGWFGRSRNLRFGLFLTALLLIFPGLFCRRHYDGFCFFWLDLIAVNLLVLFHFPKKSMGRTVLWNCLPVFVFIFSILCWFNFEYLGRSAISTNIPCRLDSELGYVHRTALRTTTSLYHFFRKILSAEMTLDKAGRRITPSAPAGNDVIFIGCSFTEGALLNDRETLPWVFSECSGVHAVNLGVSGYGIHQFLRMLELGRPWEEKTAGLNPSFILYQGMNGHIGRIAGARLPAYRLSGGTVESCRMETAPVSLLADRIKNVVFGTLFLSRFSVTHPSGKDIQLYVGAIQKCRKLLKKRYPGAQFMVLYHDGEKTPVTKQVLGLLEKDGIHVIRLSSLLMNDISEAKYRIPYDGHPSSLCWMEATPALCRKLGISVK